MLASILQSAGYKTGLYTSPHLKDFRERIRIDGKMIPEDEVVNWVENYQINNRMWKIEPSFFELTVAMAFDYFAQERVDIAVVEVGLGGRLDSTNIVFPEVSVITNIGLDHTRFLGNTLKEIAGEKAGIIKSGVPVVIGTTQEETTQVFMDRAGESGSPIWFADREYNVEYANLSLEGKQILSVSQEGQKVYPGLKLDLRGTYQNRNIPAVLKTVDLLKEKEFKVEDKHVYTGLADVAGSTGLKGRWQVIGNNPLIVCDTGHNEEGILEVVHQIRNTPFKKLHIVFGTVGDKDPDNVMKHLPEEADYYFAKADIPRAMDADKLRIKGESFGLKGNAYSTVLEAFETARKKAYKNDFIFVGGSTFLVAEVL